MELAKKIPVEPIAIRRQMQLMLEQKKYAELIESFTEKKMGGAVLGGLIFPEREDLMAEMYYYRSTAYRETGDLAAAEAGIGTHRPG